MGTTIDLTGGQISRMDAVADTLINLASGMGSDKDKLFGTAFIQPEMNMAELEAAYRGDWIARKCVDIPAEDMTREWRSWQLDKQDITKIELVESQCNLQAKLCKAIKLARLYGGSALILGVDQGEPEQELNMRAIKRGSLKFVHAVSRNGLTAGPLVNDIMSPYYGEPEYYERTSNDMGRATYTRIHPSRVIRIIGNELPDAEQMQQAWGDSVLLAVSDAIRSAGITANSVAQLLSDSKIDIVKIPELSLQMANREYEERLRSRFAMANQIKSIYSLLLIDAEEDWERINTPVQGVDALLKMFFLIAAGAVDIPATRFLSQSPVGLSATGESDTRNYYDSVGSLQKNKVTPVMSRADEIIVRSALGDYPDGAFYLWNPLWQMTEEQRAEIAKKKADTFKIDLDSGLFSPEVMRKARENQLIEDGTYPGLEQIIEGEAENFEADPDIDEDEGEVEEQDHSIKDAEPRSLYISRQVLNAGDIISWAKASGFKQTMKASELHVTVVHSRKPVDWAKMPDEAWQNDEQGRIRIRPGGMRIIEQFGEAVVLLFTSSELTYRNMRLREAGCSSDYPEYQPHITLSWKGMPKGINQTKGYPGEIILGPERFEEVNEDYREDLIEDAKANRSRSDYFTWKDDDLKPVSKTDDFNPYHEPAGSSIGGQFTSAPGGAGSAEQSRARREKAERGIGVPSEQEQKEMLNETVSDLDAASEKAIDQYTGVAYRYLNRGLRGQDATSPWPKQELDKIRDGLDAAFSKASLGRDLVTYRGLRESRLTDIRNAKDGSEFTDKGFVSTSLNSFNAAEFGGGKPMPIFLPKGSKAIPLDGLAQHQEHEVLVQRGSVFIKRTDAKGNAYLELKS